MHIKATLQNLVWCAPKNGRRPNSSTFLPLAFMSALACHISLYCHLTAAIVHIMKQGVKLRIGKHVDFWPEEGRLDVEKPIT